MYSKLVSHCMGAMTSYMFELEVPGIMSVGVRSSYIMVITTM